MNVLFVCLGNICRSPTAEAVLKSKLKEAGFYDISVDSAGTANYHIGKSPDPRTITAGRLRGYDLTELKARQVCEDDFYRFDLILAMDRANLANLEILTPVSPKAQLQLALSFTKEDIDEVPDPYYGGEEGFNQVIDLCEEIADGVIQHLKSASEGRR